MTEYSTAIGVRGELRSATGSQEMDWALNDVRRMAGGPRLTCTPATGSSGASGIRPARPASRTLIYGDGKKTKAYFAFQTLWKTVRGGWRVKRTTSTDPDLRADNRALIDGSGAEWQHDVTARRRHRLRESAHRPDAWSCLPTGRGTTRPSLTLAGLHGSDLADIFVTSASQDGARTDARHISGGTLQGGPLTLPAGSITCVVSRPAR